MSVPIFVHLGAPEYLDYVLKLTRKNNTGRIILLGDESNKEIAIRNKVEHYLVSDYNQSIPYYHVSVNGEKYEKFCFERWFIIKNFVLKNSIPQFVHSDSDNALLTDFSKFSYANASFISGTTAIVPNVFFMTTESVVQITDFYMKLYSLPFDEFKKSVGKYLDMTMGGGHYSDMYFLKQAVDECGIQVDKLDETKFNSAYNGNTNYYNVHFNGRNNKKYAKILYDSQSSGIKYPSIKWGLKKI